ncbi:MAG: dihydroxy-acid dehydratase [Ancalomicrobiaceae bacterium]|nr:dihydroxy-acid dehydratase [Ancalomicrobiaceae bacterium]
MILPNARAVTPEFADLIVEEAGNPYRDCIQGRSNEPITVRALLKRADDLLAGDAGFAGLPDYSLSQIIARLVADRPRIAIIEGSPDHPAHLLDYEHGLRAAARVWQNGGVPFVFAIPVICDGTAQSNIGQSYSLASRNHTAQAVNINFEGHSYHAAYVMAGCDKTPTGILAGLAAADRARRQPERGTAPVWAVFVPAHVLRGGSIPRGTRAKLAEVEKRAIAAGDRQLADDIEENSRYILQCSSGEAFHGQLNRAVGRGIVARSEADAILDELAAATCHEKGGICAFNGTGNSSRTLVSALGFVPRGAELLLDEPDLDIVSSSVDALFRLINKPEFAVCDILAKNYANAIRVHNATGSSTNLMLHMPAVMRHAGFDVTLFDYAAVRDAHPVPDIFAHSLTQGRDTYVLAEQMRAGLNSGMESIYKVLADLGVPMDLDAPTVTGKTWGERIAALPQAVSPELPEEKSVIRTRPIRAISGTDVLAGNFFSSATLKIAGMATEQVRRFDGRVFLVRHYENETDCNRELQSTTLVKTLTETMDLPAALTDRLRAVNGGDAGDTADQMVVKGTLAFAFVIAGQGPKAFGMPEMFAPSAYLKHQGTLERTSILMTDGRYSGVTKGACIGHVTPEAFEGGGIGSLSTGDLLWVRLTERRIDLLDRDAFLAGRLEPVAAAPIGERAGLVAERHARMQRRKWQVAACNWIDDTTSAETGVVPLSVDRRAILPWKG